MKLSAEAPGKFAHLRVLDWARGLDPWGDGHRGLDPLDLPRWRAPLVALEVLTRKEILWRSQEKLELSRKFAGDMLCMLWSATPSFDPNGFDVCDYQC